ncbi:hypothetical protein E1A91_A11G323500v1 [Gossypium mustelinum]|uniref:UDP-galactose/UDP-glucose transporter 2-like n=1 Tax=Gossypium mustelinum TaxID=34275 RepID=A0A5D2XDM0_GOSMU|nr:hypothetical protein E1A91_A11G323500v1 [Gossypium mustelinum]TYJ12075.1 hypothetical protein E1A91_A11G323500v1 [Gossypium mustelinum]
MERKTIELDQGWDYMHKGIKKLRRILEGLPEPPFTSEEYMMLYTYPSKKTEAVMKNEEQTRFLFGISLSDRPKWKQFLICSSGFFFGYLVNGICEEYVYNRLQFSYGWYFTFVQVFVYLFLIYLQGFSPKKMVNPWKTYVKLSAVLMGSHGLTKGSLAFLNYPAQLMFKSTKVLPVMVMGAFIPGLRRKYPAHEYVSAILLVLGLILFTLADAQTLPSFSVIGVIMVISALVMDSFLGNLQEAIFNMNPETTQIEMLFCSTVVGLPLLIPPMVLTGEVFEAWNSVLRFLAYPFKSITASCCYVWNMLL